jgi:hypothetical protein
MRGESVATILISERQFHAMMLPALRYHQALCLRNHEARVRTMCHRYGDQIEIVGPPPLDWPPEYIDQMMRVVNPELRTRAMIVVHWTGMPSSLSRRLQQFQVV